MKSKRQCKRGVYIYVFAKQLKYFVLCPAGVSASVRDRVTLCGGVQARKPHVCALRHCILRLCALQRANTPRCMCAAPLRGCVCGFTGTEHHRDDGSSLHAMFIELETLFFLYFRFTAVLPPPPPSSASAEDRRPFPGSRGPALVRASCLSSATWDGESLGSACIGFSRKGSVCNIQFDDRERNASGTPRC